jgi:hypothetical protein
MNTRFHHVRRNGVIKEPFSRSLHAPAFSGPDFRLNLVFDHTIRPYDVRYGFVTDFARWPVYASGDFT